MTKGYIYSMGDGLLADWFEKKYLEWQLANGRQSLDEFAKILAISRGYLSQILNGDRKTIGEKSALHIAKVLKDRTILEILDQDETVTVSSLPPELRERLRLALDEIEDNFRTRSIQPDSPEGLEISVSVLRKYGFNIIDIIP